MPLEGGSLEPIPSWYSLNTNNMPNWHDDTRFGILIHWGVYSVPSFGSEWFWQHWIGGKLDYVKFMKKRYKPNFSYHDFARDFTAEFFDATQWAELFESSGAKYVVLTAKYRDGYTLWPSTYSSGWTAGDVGPLKDLVGELSMAVKKKSMKFGIYYALSEWFNPLRFEDKMNNFRTNIYGVNKVMPELKELFQMYKPDIIMADDDEGFLNNNWREFPDWLYSDCAVKKGTVIINHRWGANAVIELGDLKMFEWENCASIDKYSCGYRRNAKLEDYMSLKELVTELVITISYGGNFLVNIGPDKDGLIPIVFQERLRGIGSWLKINGEAIFDTTPWRRPYDEITETVWYTNGYYGYVFAIMLSWPENDELILGSIKNLLVTGIEILSMHGPRKIYFIERTDFVKIYLPPSENRGQPAWTLKINMQWHHQFKLFNEKC